jgi:hypothetical protein
MKTITDKIFDVIEILKANGTIRFYSDVYTNIDMDKGNFNSVKNRSWKFTDIQIQAFVKHFNVNANYIFKDSPKMFDVTVEQMLNKNTKKEHA